MEKSEIERRVDIPFWRLLQNSPRFFSAPFSVKTVPSIYLCECHFVPLETLTGSRSVALYLSFCLIVKPSNGFRSTTRKSLIAASLTSPSLVDNLLLHFLLLLLMIFSVHLFSASGRGDVLLILCYPARHTQ